MRIGYNRVLLVPGTLLRLALVSVRVCRLHHPTLGACSSTHTRRGPGRGESTQLQPGWLVQPLFSQRPGPCLPVLAPLTIHALPVAWLGLRCLRGACGGPWAGQRPLLAFALVCLAGLVHLFEAERPPQASHCVCGGRCGAAGVCGAVSGAPRWSHKFELVMLARGVGGPGAGTQHRCPNARDQSAAELPAYKPAEYR